MAASASIFIALGLLLLHYVNYEPSAKSAAVYRRDLAFIQHI